MTTTIRPGKWCCRMVEAAARLLPAAQRQRYALEFTAELYGLPRSRQRKHSLQVLVSALQLRAALSESGTSPLPEDIMLITAKRPLRCRFGRHRWHWTSTDGHNHLQCCADCGKDRPESFSDLMGQVGPGPIGGG
jgi:hypothetical protein